MIYCGYGINGEGVYPVAAKVDAIKNAPAPRDVTQLRAFLGMINYYHKFLPNVATILEPLQESFREGQGTVAICRSTGTLQPRSEACFGQRCFELRNRSCVVPRNARWN